MTMIDKVARAIAKAVEPVQEQYWEEFVEQAKAAIEAMREPTDEMINTLPRSYVDMAESCANWERVKLYQSMIDAALKE